MERANGLFEAELSVFEAKIKSLERAEKAKKKRRAPSGSFRYQKAHRAETAMQHAHYAHLLAKYDVTLDLVHVIEAQFVATEAKVVRLPLTPHSPVATCVCAKSVQNGVGVDGSPLGSGLQSDDDSWCFEYLKTRPNQYLTSSGLGSGHWS